MTMMMNLLKKKIVNWIRKKDPSFKSGSNIIDSTSLDSFDLIDLVTFCEKNFKIKFSDLWPYNLSALNFDATDTDIEYFTADVTFKYTIYQITDLDGNPL